MACDGLRGAARAGGAAVAAAVVRRITETPFDFFPSSFVVTDCAKPQPDQSQALQRHQPHAAFVPLGPDRAARTFSLQVGSGKTFEQLLR